MNSITASAPGKFVILGEHAVVYGKPAIALAIDKRFTVRIRKNDIFSLNGEPLDLSATPHIKHISEHHGNIPVSIHTDSKIPAGSGMGSSAALSVAYSAAVRTLTGKDLDPENIANESFEAEFSAQGRGSPMDTSSSTHGGGIALNIDSANNDYLWTITKNAYSWKIANVNVPKMVFVLGYTGIRAPTGPLVERVRRYKDSNRFAKDIVDDIGRITVEGMSAIENGDVVELGELMTYNHKLLSILGVSCNELNKLVNASAPYSYGAKLTGSGGGGSMVALTDQPEKVCEAILARGGQPFVVKTGVTGVEVSTSE